MANSAEQKKFRAEAQKKGYSCENPQQKSVPMTANPVTVCKPPLHGTPTSHPHKAGKPKI